MGFLVQYSDKMFKSVSAKENDIITKFLRAENLLEK